MDEEWTKSGRRVDAAPKQLNFNVIAPLGPNYPRIYVKFERARVDEGWMKGGQEVDKRQNQPNCPECLLSEDFR